MRHPIAEDDVLGALTQDWLAGITQAGFVPGVRARARAALQELLEELVAAVRSEPFDPAVGRRIGAELVDLRMSAPAVVGATVRVLGAGLPRVTADDGVCHDRVLALLDQLTTGFVTAQRDAALGAAEQMNRSEKIHWRRVQTDLQQRLHHDPRTSLPNEQHLRTRLTSGGGQRMGLCLIAVDRYAELADTLGHDNAGLLLAAVAHRLRQVTEPAGHFLAHVGDDQFAVAVADTRDADDVIKLAEDARHAMLAPFPLGGHALRVGVTAGVVEDEAAGAGSDHWLRDARLALGWARQERRDHAVFEGPRAEADRTRHRLAAALPAALDAGEFVAHYQPVYCLRDRAVFGVEALARWQRPGGAPPLLPRDFIPLAEQTGVIRPLGRLLLEQACRQAVAWPGRFVSVNLSPLQLGDAALAAEVADILHRTGLPADRLQLEIADGTALDDGYDTLRHLADLGVRLTLDDFGTGCSSLAALSRLPIHTVKLAAEFIVDTGGRAAVEVLRHVIRLCHALGVTVTAKGIESADQERLLESLGCDLGQGFHFAEPATATQIAALLTPQMVTHC